VISKNKYRGKKKKEKKMGLIVTGCLEILLERERAKKNIWAYSIFS
jgi:hypothetical protein